jgi:hypothetical protein
MRRLGRSFQRLLGVLVWPARLAALVALLASLSATRASAGNFNAFGPELYPRASAAPVTVNKSFSVLNPNTTYTLRIQLPKGSAVNVTVNGVLVLSAAEEFKKPTVIERPVILESSNEIAVQVLGKPGVVVAIEVLGVDNDAPSIIPVVTPPPNANGWNNTDVDVSFTCDDLTSAIAFCSPPSTLTSEGANQMIPGVAEDVAGNQASTTVIVNIDETDPEVSLGTSPQPNAAGWNKTDVDVRLIALDALSGIDAVPVACMSIVNHCLDPVNDTITLTAEGPDQSVAGIAMDLAGNQDEDALFVNIDKTAPDVEILSPPDGTTTRASSIDVSGSATDANPIVSVTCNGILGVVQGSTFTCAGVPLAPGPNPIEVIVLDIADNSATDRTSANLLVGPAVTISIPANLALFSSSPITVAGNVDDAAATVIVNGVTATVTPAGTGATFEATGVPLREGPNLVTATATDAANAVGTASISVTLDTTAPTVVIDFPPNDFVSTSALIEVTGMTNDAVSGMSGQEIRVSVNGRPAVVMNRTFVLSGLMLRRGPNTITAVGVDTAGNASRAHSITVTLQDLAGQRVSAISGNNQTGVPRTTLLDPLVVRLIDSSGDPVPGRTVSFTVTRNDGLVSPSTNDPGAQNLFVTTDVNGEASVFFTLGSRVGTGNNRVTASSVGFVGEAVFCASSHAMPPDRVLVSRGENQRGVVGQTLAEPFEVVVTDAHGNPVPNLPITFEVLSGGGNFAGAPSLVTNTMANGMASAVMTLGPSPGININVVRVTFAGNQGQPATFVASGFLQGRPEDTRISGVVLDGTDAPLEGVIVTLRGLTRLQTTTDDQGQFLLTGVPVGAHFLEADGSSIPPAHSFPHLAFAINTLSGQDNRLPGPIHLPRLDLASARVVGGNQDVILEMAGVPGFRLKVFANSVTFPDGSHQGTIDSSQVALDRVPMAPEAGVVPGLAGSFHPPNVVFDPPAQIVYPNTTGMSPGAIIDIYSFDHTLERFVPVGTGTVSADGSVVTSDPGFGISKSGWHYVAPPAPRPGCVGGCGPCMVPDPSNACLCTVPEAIKRACLEQAGRGMCGLPCQFKSGAGQIPIVGQCWSFTCDGQVFCYYDRADPMMPDCMNQGTLCLCCGRFVQFNRTAPSCDSRAGAAWYMGGSTGVDNGYQCTEVRNCTDPSLRVDVDGNPCQPVPPEQAEKLCGTR